MKKEYATPEIEVSKIADVITLSQPITFDGKSTPFTPASGTPKIDGKETDFIW